MKVLIIQTAFIGDVILASAVVEALSSQDNINIDFLLRKGNESLLVNNPKVNEILIWDKDSGKYANLFGLLKKIRKSKYDVVINLQRFASTGFLAAFSKAKLIVGYDKNPFHWFFHKKYPHVISDEENGLHEVDRVLKLLDAIVPVQKRYMPKLYLTREDKNVIPQRKNYIVFAPASVWFTKQLPVEKWIELARRVPGNINIYFIGGKGDKALCDEIIEKTGRSGMYNYAGELSLTESAGLISETKMTYTNDSAPMHICSALNVPVTVFFCSTIPAFGFGPLSDVSHVVQVKEELACRPCGLHGYKKCPKNHFKCGYDIEIDKVLTPY